MIMYSIRMGNMVDYDIMNTLNIREICVCICVHVFVVLCVYV